MRDFLMFFFLKKDLGVLLLNEYYFVFYLCWELFYLLSFIMPRFAVCSFILRLLLYSLCLYIVLVLKCIYMSDIVLFNLFGYLAAVKCGRQVNPDNFLWCSQDGWES